MNSTTSSSLVHTADRTAMAAYVNNCQYVQMAVEELEEELGRTLDIRKLRAEYKNSAVYGDIIYPVLEDTGELYRAALCDKDGKPYAVIELEDKGEER